MATSLTDTLCTHCALCCDGSLFADVELAGRSEATRLELMGFEIEEGDAGAALLAQPCAALRGTRCGIYAHRPGCCRTFECKLLQDARRETVSIELAQAHIAETRGRIARLETLLARLGRGDAGMPLRERCAEVLGRPAGGSRAESRTRAEVETGMAELEQKIRKIFLGGRR